MIGTATWLEIAFTIIAAIGFLVDVPTLHEAWLDYNYLTNLNLRGGRRIIAVGNIRNAFTRMMVQVIELAIGFITMFTAPVDPNRPITTVGIAFAVGFMSIAVLTMISSVLDRQERSAMIDWHKREGSGRRSTDTDGTDLQAILDRQKQLLTVDARLREKDIGLRAQDEELRAMDRESRERTKDILDMLESKAEEVAASEKTNDRKEE